MVVCRGSAEMAVWASKNGAGASWRKQWVDSARMGKGRLHPAQAWLGVPVQRCWLAPQQAGVAEGNSSWQWKTAKAKDNTGKKLL